MKRSARVSIVDEQPVILSGLRELFSTRDDFEVVSLGTQAKNVVEFARQGKSDIIVVDVTVPGYVVESIALVSEMVPSAKVVVFTASQDAGLAIKALEAGARGYVLKSSPLRELVEALHQVLAGETFVTATFAMKVAAGVQKEQKRPQSRFNFSRREEEVLHQLLLGQTNKEIASILSISEKTVKQYMTTIIQKMNVRNRVEVVLAAQELIKANAPSRVFRQN